MLSRLPKPSDSFALAVSSRGWRWSRLFCVVWFTLSSVGLPVGLPSSEVVGSGATRCNCAAELKSAGKCCCGVRARNTAAKAQPVTRTTCCARGSTAKTPPVATTAGCCARGKTQPAKAVGATNLSIESRNRSQDSATGPGIEPCGCGSTSSLAHAPHQDHRILPELVQLTSPAPNCGWILNHSELASSVFLPPPVPPPKLS